MWGINAKELYFIHEMSFTQFLLVNSIVNFSYVRVVRDVPINVRQVTFFSEALGAVSMKLLNV